MKRISYLLICMLAISMLYSCKDLQNMRKTRNKQESYMPDSNTPISPEKMSFFTYMEATGRNIEPSTNAVNLPLVAEVSVLPKKIVYVETEAFKDITVTEAVQAYGANFKTVGIAEYKRIALAKAANANNADLIVGATFVVETTNDNHFSIKVVGYPAVYKNFHTATKKDAEILNDMDPFIQKTYYDPVLNLQSSPIETTTTIKQ